MKTVCRFICNEVHSFNWSQGQRIKFNAVGPSKDPEDTLFSTATPSGEISIHVDNQAVLPMFQLGKKYKVTIELIEEEEAK